MHDATTDWVDWKSEAELEEAGTRLLRDAGVTARDGVRRPRGEEESRRGKVAWQEWFEAFLPEPGGADVGDLLEGLARLAQLTAEQQIVLELHVEDYSYRDIARLLRVTIWRVRCLLAGALRRCRACADGVPLTPRALFWQEVAEKRQRVYRAPVRWRGSTRRLRWVTRSAAADQEDEFRTLAVESASEGATVPGMTKGPNR